MSINNEEEFKIEQNHKVYSVIISIQEDQLCLVLIYYSIQPIKYSGFFSLNELRISSKIFEHTKSLFEAKEIIKRTVIKKQLLIDEDEFKARITFDTGLGHDSVPFPITLFRDSDEKFPNRANFKGNNITNNNINDMEDPKDNLKKSFINKIKANNNRLNFLNDNRTNSNTNKILRASIGNNVNNKMLNNVPGNSQIQFNNSKKILTSSQMFLNNTIKQNNTNLMYKEVDLRNNYNNKTFGENGLNNNNNKVNMNKDFLAMNNNILYNIYNNMNANNNVNSSFYKDLSKSFTVVNNQNQLLNNNVINTNINTITNNTQQMKKIVKNIDNNLSQSNVVQVPNINNMNNISNINNINTMNIPNQINNKYFNTPVNINPNNINNINIPMQPINPNQNLKQNQNNPILVQNTYQQYNNNQINNQNIPKPIPTQGIIINNQSFHTAPLQRNVVQIPNVDSRINKNLLFNDNKRKTFNKTTKNENMRLSISEESEEENNMEINLDEYNQVGEQPYRFKNLLIHGSKKVKGNLEKFKQNQNIGDYRPSGTKYVSYLKFPDTKKNISNNSLTLSTISSSYTSGSNRVIGIEKNIIKHPGELDEISSRLQRILGKRNIKYRILFRSNIDGDLASTFHMKCDKIKNTLVLIKASGNKRFGGFTTETWDGNDVNKKDEKSFIFSIDKMKIYDVLEGEYAINCNPDLGPVFVNQIKLLDQFFTQGGTTSKKGINFNTLEDFEITDGAEKFGVQEVEVYQIK